MGESFDIAQFEAMVRLQSQYPNMYFAHGEDYVKEGSHSLICALYGTYTCADGGEVLCISIFSITIWIRKINLFVDVKACV